MDLFTLGNGSIHVDWNGVEGESGLEPRLILKGHLVAKGYAIGALLQVSAKVTATEIEGNSALLGSTVPEFYALNWVKNRPNVEGLPPADETPWDLRLPLPLSSAVIEGLEARRHGRDFWLQLDVKFVLVDKGEVHDGAHPLMTSQTTFKVSQNDWAQVLERVGTGSRHHRLTAPCSGRTRPRACEDCSSLEGCPAENRRCRLRRIIR